MSFPSAMPGDRDGDGGAKALRASGERGRGETGVADEWSCTSCTMRNPGQARFCHMCNQPHRVLVRKPTGIGSGGPASVRAPQHARRSPECDNPPTGLSASRSAEGAPVPQPSRRRAVTSLDAAGAPPTATASAVHDPVAEQQWDCNHCTFKNDVHFPNCLLCKNRRGSKPIDLARAVPPVRRRTLPAVAAPDYPDPSHRGHLSHRRLSAMEETPATGNFKVRPPETPRPAPRAPSTQRDASHATIR